MFPSPPPPSSSSAPTPSTSSGSAAAVATATAAIPASGAGSEEGPKGSEEGEEGGVPLCKSFMHLHLAVRKDMLDPKLFDDDDNNNDQDSDSETKKLPPQWTVVNSWEGPIDSPGKVVCVMCPQCQCHATR
jgi:hypothetical protein